MTEKQNNLPQIPKGWTWTKVGDIAEINPKLPKDNIPYDMEVSFLPMKAVEARTGKFDLSLIRKYSEVRKGYTPFADGDIIFAKITPCMENGKIAIVNNLKNGIGFGSTEFHVVRLIENDCSKEYVFHYLLQEHFRRQARRHMKGTAGQLRVPRRFLEDALIPLPPFSEQYRIVGKVDELFTRLDAGVESLGKLKAQLKRYRQAFLKHAFEGKLTERWRNAHKDQIEPVQAFLERMGEEQKKNTGGKPRESSLIDSSGLYELPISWMWIRLGEVTESMKNGIYKPKRFYSDDGIACLRMYNIESGKIVWKDIKRMILTSEEVHAYELKAGDILVNRVNSRELVGKAAVIPKDLEICVYESKNIRLRLLGNLVENKYVNFWLQIFRQKYFNRHAQQTVGMASINQEQLSSMPVPLSPLLEQRKIVEEIEHSFSIVDEIEKNVNHGMAQAEKLRQAVLRKAFWGKLALQDPTDEPAEKLLERIREEKEKRKSEEKGIKGKRKGRRTQMGLISYVK